jgi:hypothetical protein
LIAPKAILRREADVSDRQLAMHHDTAEPRLFDGLLPSGKNRCNAVVVVVML